jgi:hypothetical protein
MDGVREASAHTIVFQSRAGTPELNCCSVNGPRVLGMLSEWAVMSTPRGLAVNSYLPGTFTVSAAGQEIRLVLDRDYPVGDSQRVRIAKSGDAEWTLRLRIPAWSANTRVQANFAGALAHALAGSYLEIRRRWRVGDEVALQFDFGLRAVAGANETAGKISLYRGPLLLAWDQAHTLFDEDKIPPVDLSRLAGARAATPIRSQSALESPAWLQVDLPTEHGATLRLVDFASAGSAGTHYRSWLTASEPPPPPAFTLHPRDGERIRPGAIQFQWRMARSHTNLSYRVEVSAEDGFTKILLATNLTSAAHMALEVAANPNAPGPERWWRVITVGLHGETAPDVPPARFTLDPEAPAQTLPPSNKPGPNGELILHSLRGEAAPTFGRLNSSKKESHDAEGTQVNGRDQMLVYSIPAWPEQDFTVAVRVRINEMPKGRLGQIFSAWTAGMDDPLRLAVENGKLFARIEAGQLFGTAGTPIPTGTWHHVAAVKSGSTLKLFLDGQPAGSCAAPEFSTTTTRDCALGGNPKFTGNEFLAAAFADFGMWERALSPAEVQRLASQ